MGVTKFNVTRLATKASPFPMICMFFLFCVAAVASGAVRSFFKFSKSQTYKDSEFLKYLVRVCYGEERYLASGNPEQLPATAVGSGTRGDNIVHNQEVPVVEFGLLQDARVQDEAALDVFPSGFPVFSGLALRAFLFD